MRMYAPDTDVLVRILRAGQARGLAACGRLPVLVTDTVWDELTVEPVLRAREKREGDEKIRAIQRACSEAEALLRAIVGEPTRILAGSREADLLARLMLVRRVGPGEDSVIALALANRDVVPVFIDGKAIRRCVEERPGSNLLSLYGFLEALRTECGVSADVIDAVVRHVQNDLALPLWWDQVRFA